VRLWRGGSLGGEGAVEGGPHLKLSRTSNQFFERPWSRPRVHDDTVFPYSSTESVKISYKESNFRLSRRVIVVATVCRALKLTSQRLATISAAL